ncbi:MAG: PDZ domain-containing protein [Verrucomicrobia bacterium]|nr:PDZ domain-containing protein [Verrucomicrobiota bacterium]
MKRLIQLLVILLVALPWSAWPSTPNESRGSLVRVRASIQPYDQFRPWQKKSPFGLSGTGVVLSRGRVLVTASLVANRTEVGLEKPGSAEKCAAEVEAIDYEANLALLKPTDDQFLKGFSGVSLGTSLKAGDTAEVWQLERNGEMLRNQAEILSAGVGRYPSDEAGFLVYGVRVSLPKRDDSYTLPLMRNGQLSGMLMAYDRDSQEGTAIPVPMIEHFLKDSSDGKYEGFPTLGVSWSPLRDPNLREEVKAPSDGGILLMRVNPIGTAGRAGLKEGDVLLTVDGFRLDEDGNYRDPLYGPTSIGNLVRTRPYVGAIAKFRISRNGDEMELTGNYDRRARDEVAIPTLQFDLAPRYLILGGLVFQELSGAYLQEWGEKWPERAPQRLVQLFSFQQEMKLDPKKKIVFLSQVLPSATTAGYQHLSGLVLSGCNGTTVGSLEELASIADSTTSGDLVFEFMDDPKKLVLDAAEVKSGGDKLGKAYGIPALRKL